MEVHNTVVTINFTDLHDSSDLRNIISSAFGFNGLGILLVNNVPGLAELRSQTLPLIKKFAELPDNIKEKYEHPQSYYSFGWSHGKEKMKKDTPDVMKGSYYFNPEYDSPYEEEYIKKFPLLCHPNIWPLEVIPNFSHKTMQLSALVMNLAKKILFQCDKYINSIYPDHDITKLLTMASTCRVNKGRLLHYFPVRKIEQDQNFWCGFHNDHGFLTGLLSSMYLDSNYAEVSPPDNNCGLYIKSRSGDTIKIKIPENSIAFQIGESACICSGGLLQATPHYVRAPGLASDISRESLAIFISAKWDTIIDPPKDCSLDNIFRGSTNQYLPQGVPLLETRWKPGMDYETFCHNTYASYY